MSARRSIPLLMAGGWRCPCRHWPLIVGGSASRSPEIRPRSFVAAVKRSGPAVVTLETARTVRSASSVVWVCRRGLMQDPVFRRFFGLPRATAPRSRVQRGQGSGVIFDAKGLLLTNAHVVEGADQLTVDLLRWRRVSGQVVGQDSLTDLAVVRLDQGGPGRSRIWAIPTGFASVGTGPLLWVIPLAWRAR